VDEALRVEVLALDAVGRSLVAEAASDEEWARYREYRARVLEAAGVSELADAVAQS
jgi:hypothetical protein